MKKNYYLEQVPQPKTGKRLLHAEGCEKLPRDRRAVQPIGRFHQSCTALAEARRRSKRADGCATCCCELFVSG